MKVGAEKKTREVIKYRIWVKITLEIYQINKYTILKRDEILVPGKRAWASF